VVEGIPDLNYESVVEPACCHHPIHMTRMEMEMETMLNHKGLTKDEVRGGKNSSGE
jgi:hypothetical protein